MMKMYPMMGIGSSSVAASDTVVVGTRGYSNPNHINSPNAKAKANAKINRPQAMEIPEICRNADC
jgi:hypothetical protein